MKSKLGQGATRSYPIVGMHFRHQHGTPAKGIVKALSLGTRLTLQAEPTNPFDANAVMVLLRGEDIPDDCMDRLSEACGEYGHTAPQIAAEPVMHLGYIPRELAALLRQDDRVPADGTEVEAEFACSRSGAPMAVIEDKGL
jgi:hypothetical protein